ncbi:hypothetical protein GCM10010124_14790 [Pilimelia terevasa]|uniref:IraD/Gp25-like domain-containing protein n=1 Tax=Pilimelia terevasa TaxID=53372 RepID=A0A8J3BLN8_9ACTN|nr:GPW/gp25 family protein [Pilimelia terevasa]GGK23340.1 hypothetical protein GCM10010124_14790 [Pilimelia terevasa]
MSVEPDLIGARWAYPVRTDATGAVALVRGDRALAESIRLILGTAPGERPMRPAFGCAIHDLVFAPADAATAGQIAYAVRVALELFEPRITVDDVRVSFADADAGALLIDVHYTARNSNDPRNLVFPFYVIPPEGRAPDPAEVAAAADALDAVPQRRAVTA